MWSRKVEVSALSPTDNGVTILRCTICVTDPMW
jgi:hypothetical protein